MRPRERLKQSANRLAGLLGSQEGLRILRTLAEFESAGASTYPNHKPASALTLQAPGQVGIWQREPGNEEVCFVREQESWGLWADVETIRLRDSAKRVVLLGESVARGFFYDPHFNPAMALERILRSAAGDDRIDVIDLARIGVELKELLEIAHSSIELEPEVIVFLAGNNWRPGVGLSAEDRQDITAILSRDGSWSQVKAFVEERLRDQVNNLISSLASLADAHKVQIVIIIPEFNLLDWREDGGPALLLDSAENDQWIRARTQASIAFSKGDFKVCAELAWTMLRIDGGTSSAGYRLLSDIALKKGEMGEAREFLECARDVGIFLPRGETPRCYSIIQESLRRAAGSQGFAIVDLPKLFEEYLDGALPGRELFHDYCHLTATGVSLAMSATAEAILPMIEKNARPWRELLNLSGELDDGTLGEAHFLAAIHNANWDQGFEIVRHHCVQALRCSPFVAEAMQLYADIHIRRAPSLLCRSFLKVATTKSPHAMSFFHTAPRDRKQLNLRAIQAITSALETIGLNQKPRFAELVKQQHGVLSADVDLLQLAYCSTSYAMPEGYWPDKAAFYRAYDSTSRFLLICERSCAVKLVMTYRAKTDVVSSECLKLEINGREVACMSASQSWETRTVNVPAENIAEGENWICLKWPLPSWSKEDMIEQISEKIDRGDFFQIYPVFGELHTFRASANVQATIVEQSERSNDRCRSAT